MMSQPRQLQLKSKSDSKIFFLGLVISVVLCYFALFIEYRYLFTLDYYIFESSSLEEAYEWYRKEQSIIWLNIVGIFIVILVRDFIVSLILYSSHKVTNIAVRYVQELSIASVATTVFGLNYIVSVVGKVCGLISYTSETVNNNYRYQSVNVLFNGYGNLNHLKAPLDLLNISQIVFIVVLIITSRIILSPNTKSAKIKTSISTLIGYLAFLFLMINIFVLINIFKFYK